MVAIAPAASVTWSVYEPEAAEPTVPEMASVLELKDSPEGRPATDSVSGAEPAVADMVAVLMATPTKPLMLEQVGTGAALTVMGHEIWLDVTPVPSVTWKTALKDPGAALMLGDVKRSVAGVKVVLLGSPDVVQTSVPCPPCSDTFMEKATPSVVCGAVAGQANTGAAATVKVQHWVTELNALVFVF
jgi:hypothetical protein